MAKELLLYFGIQSYTVEDLINKLEENADEEVILRVNSPGGDAMAAWGLYSKVEEHGNVTLKYDGMGCSAAANLILYCQKAECLDVTTFLFHRAASYGEDDPETKRFVEKVNSDMRKKLTARVSDEKFKKVTGHTIEEMFSMETRLNIWLNAKQMKELGLVSKIRTLKPSEQKAMAQAMAQWKFDIAAMSENEPPTPPINQNMTLEKLKAEFPAIYNAILEAGEKAGVKKENDRVMAWMAFAAIDAKKVVEGIEKGEPITARAMAEFQATSMSPEYLAKLQKDSAGAIKTEANESADPNKDAGAKALEAFAGEVHAHAGLKKETKAA